MVKDKVAGVGFTAVAGLALLLSLAGCGSKGSAFADRFLAGVGRPCDLTVDAGSNQAVYNASSGDCPKHLCLKPQVQQGAAGSVDTGPTCSAECSQDSDCGGELRDPTNPVDHRCTRGFACGIPMVVGPLSCKKLCVCKDFLGPSGLPTPAACLSGTGSGTPASGVGEETDIYVSVSPTRLLDMVFMVDNSPASMPPKVAKMNAQFPKLIAALKDPNDGTLPDLRVAIIDSDLGTGNALSPGSCGTKFLADGTASPYGDLGRFQMLSSPTACSFNAGAEFLEYKAGTALNYTGDINTVFACLTGNLGTLGCGEEHQLQAFEFALAAHGIGNEKQQADFMRGNAYLGLVFLTDEDDCSAAQMDGMFGDKPELRSETGSLRCATRSHMCGGQKLTNSPPGYPTDSSFTHAFKDCQARMGDECAQGTDTSVPTDCNPLRSVKTMADEMKALKADPDNQILVAGIFGWPLSDADMAMAQYKIAPLPNPNTADTQHPTMYDYWPVCYDPTMPPSTLDPATGFPTGAAGMGATGGLRESAFVDEFGDNGLKFSICQTDFTQTMTTIGQTIAKKLQNLCVDYKLLDADLATPGLQPECRVVWRTPTPDPKDSTKLVYQESPNLPQCPAGATQGNVSEDCWQLASDKTQCPVNGQLLQVLRTAQEIAANPKVTAGTKIGMRCRTCPDGATNLDPSSAAYQACNY